MAGKSLAELGLTADPVLEHFAVKESVFPFARFAKSQLAWGVPMPKGSPNIVDRIKAGAIALVINTTAGKKEISDSYSIRRESLVRGLPYFTTVEAARMMVGALEAQLTHSREYRPLQEWLGLDKKAQEELPLGTR